MQASRRTFFKSAMSLGIAGSAYASLAGCSPKASDEPVKTGLVADPEGLLDLPPGFTYSVHSRAGDIMSDGLKVPASHDGMACFPVEGDADRCILIRNHELDPDEGSEGPFAGVAPTEAALKAAYDVLPDGTPMPGGTTTMIFNLKTREVERSFLSLSGTLRNCAGGITPWGSWISCEESTDEKHGYAFEVSASATGPVPTPPLAAMGRFKREAVAIDPRTGIVYQTEDEHDSLIYRFIPDAPGELAKGGRLQVLAIMDKPAADTRNWDKPDLFPAGGSWDVHWIDVDDVTAERTPLRQQGYLKGAAVFARGEGMCAAIEKTGTAIYFACTIGGQERLGQIWKYLPASNEGAEAEGEKSGKLVLHYESQNVNDMDMCDNIVAAPWGDLIICEDGDGDQFVRGVSPDGHVYPIARNAHPDKSEFAGACFSPDGDTLFVNMQGPNATLAIRGPWAKIIRA